MRLYFITVVSILFIAVAAPQVYGGGDVDKSGLKPQVLKLPSGPGSINGLGESFEPQLNSGTGAYRIPLALPPGRAGFMPNVTLNYNGGNGNSPFGIGWRLSLDYVQRRTDKGIPVYDDAKDTFVTAGGEELVLLADGTYRCENETAFDLYARDGSAWKVTHKNGSGSFFGINPTDRIQDEDHIFKWFISRSQDTNGNEIRYFYNEASAFSQGTPPDDGQTYLTSITYNHTGTEGIEIRIAFKYETREEYDQVFDYRSRFPVQTSQRCSEIIMFEATQRVRSYTLIYDPDTILSRLSQVETYGKDASQGPLESILTLGYSDFALNSTITPMNNGLNPSVGLDLENADIVDMNRDALPDLLYTGDVHTVYLNSDGRTWEYPYEVEQGFSEVKLNNANTMLMDMNGDGRTDLFTQDVSINGYRYFPGGQPNNGWRPIPVEMSNSPLFTFNYQTKAVDLDHDGCTDVLQKGTLSSEITCVFNLDGLAYSGLFSIDSPSRQAEFEFGQEGNSALHLADMNGDGLQDFVVLNGEDQIWYYPGHGVTIDPSTPWEYQGWDNTARGAWPEGMTGAEGYRMANAPDRYDDPDLYEVSNFHKLRLVDVNGDGLSDLVYVGNNRLLVWLNMGGHAFSPEPYTIEPESGQIPSMTAYTYVRLVDMNANGTVDVVWNCQIGFTEIGLSDATWAYMDLTNGTKPNLLTEIKNGIGQTTTIQYKSSTEYLIADRQNNEEWTLSPPFPVNVVSRIEVSDGLGHTYANTMSYRDGYYDGVEKEFRGFESATKIEHGDLSAPDLVMAYTFDTGAVNDALKGMPLEVTAKTSADKVFYREINTWLTRDLAAGINGDDRTVTFPYLETRIKDIYEKQSTPVQLKWGYEYDNYGNTTKLTEYGRMDAGWDDERITTTTYTAGYPSGLSNWILDKVVEETITDENGVRVAQTRNYYDKMTALGQVTKGNLTQTQAWKEGDTFVTSIRNDYDGYGNIVAAYDPLYGTEPGHYRQFIFDETYHTFLEEEHIHTGTLTLKAIATYDYGLGVIKTSRDYNGNETIYDYDTFGRLQYISKPLDTGHTIEYEYVLDHELSNGQTINWVETRRKDGSPGDGFLKARSFYDGLGRKIMTRSEGEEDNQIVVSDTVEYNARKTIRKQYLPYFETNTLDYTDPSYNTGYIEHLYDALGRKIKQIQPGGAFGETLYGPLTRTVHDEEQTNGASLHAGCGRRYVTDGLLDENGQGRLRDVYEIVKLSDAGEPLTTPVEWKTSYTYDLMGNLTGYTDSQNNRKIIQYDGLSRKIFSNDPDRGHFTFNYDDAGNLLSTLDAKGQVIEYSYDGANRLTKEFYGENKIEPDVEYHYDTSFGAVDRGQLFQSSQAAEIANAILGNGDITSELDLNQDGKVDVADVVKAARDQGNSDNTVTSENTLGFLSWVKDQSGEEHNSYDARGRVKWVVKRIADKDRNLHNFYEEMTYDSMDRVRELIYPDQTYVSYTYNTRGLLDSVPGIVDNLDYNPSGQNKELKLNCGTTTTYEYDERLRLYQLKTARARDSLDLQDYTYHFDDVSNIESIDDNRSNTTLTAIGMDLGIGEAESRKYNATQSFVYDSLYRLNQATNPTVYGTIDYRYDKIGNMISKNADLLDPDTLMDLGTMTNGGTGGTSGRIGRSAGDPPGPHALTSTQNGTDGPIYQYTYDDNGNMTTDRDLDYTWDYNDRLAGIMDSTKSAAYVYDYTGTRKHKSVTDNTNGSSTEVIYISKYCELREGRLIKYIYAGNNRIARMDTESDGLTAFSSGSFYLQDHLGTTAMTLSDNGTVIENFAYNPFGRLRFEYRKDAAKTIADYKFTGKERDVESGLDYFEARYYDSVTARFISVDSITPELYNPQALNLYGYCMNNPLIYTDPSGHEVTRDAALPFSQFMSNVRAWENNLKPGTNILKAFKKEIHDNALFGSSGSFTSRGPYGKSDRNKLRWHYVYTKNEKWIDFGHFSNAAYLSDKWGLNEFTTKVGGLGVEVGQFLSCHIPGWGTATKTSAFTREDFRSNRLGVEFAKYYKSVANTTKFSDALEQFLIKYNPVEDEQSGEGYHSLPESQDQLDKRRFFTNLANAYKNAYKNGPSGIKTLFKRSNPD